MPPFLNTITERSRPERAEITEVVYSTPVHAQNTLAGWRMIGGVAYREPRELGSFEPG